MFSLNLLIALRGLYREKNFVVLTLLGFSIAFTCALILWPYAAKLLAYDRHYAGHKRIFRIAYDYRIKDSAFLTAETSPVLGILFSRRYPEVADYTRIYWRNRTSFRHNDTVAYWNDIYVANENYFELFQHKILYGDPHTALQDPHSIAISESFAQYYFGDANPLGKTLSSDTTDHQVTLVFADLPDNTHIKFSALTSWNLTRQSNPAFFENLEPRWVFAMGGHTFFRLKPGFSTQDLSTLLQEFYDSSLREYGEETGQEIRFIIQPLSTIHFGSGFQNDRPTTNLHAIYGLLIIVLLLLIIAAVNYINLSIGRAQRHAKSVSVRQILGAGLWQLAWRFIVESLVLCFTALLFAIVLTELFLSISDNPLQGASLSNGLNVTTAAILLTLIYALFNGLYLTYFYNDRFLSRKIKSSSGKASALFSLSNVIIFLQLFASMFVLTTTLIMSRQLNYISITDVGFKIHDQLIIPIHTADVVEKIPLATQKLRALPTVNSASLSDYYPGGRVPTYGDKMETTDGLMESMEVKHFFVDREFLKTMELDVIEGSGFSEQSIDTSTTPVVVNEALVQARGWTNPLGKRIEMYNRSEGRVIGVIKNFHYWSFHKAIEPLRLVPFRENEFAELSGQQRKGIIRYLIVNIVPGETATAIGQIESILREFDPLHPFEYHLLQDLVDGFYRDEQQQARFTAAFAAVSLLITGLGLVGFIAFTTEQQSKVIGIRKVLGASTWQLQLHFLKPILVLLILASILATIITYIATQAWLADFSYRPSASVLFYFVSPLFVATLVCVTVSLCLYRTTTANPVEALRYE